MPIGRLIIDMALPIIVAMTVHALYNIIDGIFVSRINLEAFNAISLAMPVQRLISSVAIGCAIGINAVLSNALGRQDDKKIRKIVESGMLISCVCSLAFIIFGLFCIRPIISAQTDNPVVIEYAVQYLRIICIFSFSGFFEVTIERFLISSGRTSLTMISQIAGTVLNLIMDPVFIFTLNLGVSGAAISTVLSQFIAMILAFYLNEKYNSEIKINKSIPKPCGNIIADICKVAIPAIVTNLTTSVMIFGLNAILYNYTSGMEISQNVFGVYSKLNSLSALPVMGIGNAVIPIIAFNLGQKDFGRVRETIIKSLKFSIVINIVLTVLFLIMPKPLLSIFMGAAGDTEARLMYAAGIPALRIISLSFIFSGITMTLCSVFQGMGNGMYSAVPAITRQILFLLPAAYVLARLGFAAGTDTVVWYSFLIAEFLSMLLALFMCKKEYRRISSEISEEEEFGK